MSKESQTPQDTSAKPSTTSQVKVSSHRKRISLRIALFSVLCLIAAAALVIFFFSRTKPPVRARSLGARLELAAGEVIVREKENTGTKVLSGTPLAIGSRITTGHGSRALVRTADGSSIFLNKESEIVLEARGFSIEKGEVWVDAPRADNENVECKISKHIISASDAGLSIRRDGENVTAYVARGLAILTSPGGRVEINSGEQAIAKATEAPKVSAVAFWHDWTGGMGDSRPTRNLAGSGAGRIYGIDLNASSGAPVKPLGIAKQLVKSVIRDGFAETEVDQTFSNPSGQNIEGWYWFTVPPEAAVTGFALETDGVLVEGEVVERKEAAAKYTQLVAQSRDPALLEWIDGRTYRARIFPIPANGTRRVVLRYIEILPTIEGKTRYVYPMRSNDTTRLDEFSFVADLGEEAQNQRVSTSLDAVLEEGGKRISMRRSGYIPRADFQIEMARDQKRAPVRTWRFSAGADQADYIALRYVPDLDFAKLPAPKGELVLVVDTSAGGDESARRLRIAAAESILRALSDEDLFSVVALDVNPTVVYPAEGLAHATESDITKAIEKLNDHGIGGATDMGAMFEPALRRLHNTEQPAVVYVGDGAPTSGETQPDPLTDRLRRSFAGSRARFFAVGVGPDARHELLTQLTRVGGGQYMRVTEPDQATGEALRLASAIKTSTITDLEIDLGVGLDQPFYSANGKLARGEELLLLARTHHQLPEKIRIKGRAGGSDFNNEYPLQIEKGIVTALAPRLWAAEYMHRLLGSGASPEEHRTKILELGLEYGLMTPFTSILALDSNDAYARQGIKRRSSHLRGVRLTAIENTDHEKALARMLIPEPLKTVMGCSKPEKSSSTTMSNEMSEPRSAQKQMSFGSRSNELGSRNEPGIQASAAPAPTSLPNEPLKIAKPSSPKGGETEIDGHEEKSDIQGGLTDRDKNKSQNRLTTIPSAISSPSVTAISKDEHDKPTQLALTPKEGKPNVDAKKTIAFVPPTKPSPFRHSPKPLGRCSDSSSRSLFERILLWQKRLKSVSEAHELIAAYESARTACELPDWRDQAALLNLIQQKIKTEQTTELVLAHFFGEPEAQQFIARSILKRTVDVRIAAAVSRSLFGSIDWAKVDRDLSELTVFEEQRRYLESAILIAPGDPQGEMRLIRLLAQKGSRQEAIAYGRRLRDRGFLTPTLAQLLGDLLSESGAKEEALRTYSEVIEFDPESALSRRVLGDIYLRQGWFKDAYRQYKTLTDLEPKDASNWLRLAHAAVGSGRIDEALRIEKDIATGEGTPGPNDPRYWARLWSATRLSLLRNDPALAQGAATPEAINRKLKELQLFSGTGTLNIIAWTDIDARLALVPANEIKDVALGEKTDASVTGLYAVLAPTESTKPSQWAVRWISDAPMGRAVKFQFVSLIWDGKTFQVKVQPGELKAENKQINL